MYQMVNKSCDEQKRYKEISEYTLYLIQAIQLVQMAKYRLIEVGYVWDTYKKLKKLNPFIAYSNTRLADQDNVNKFDGWAIEGIDLYRKIPIDSIRNQILLQNLTSLLLKSYIEETEALESRLKIYDSMLLPNAKELRMQTIKELQASGSDYNEDKYDKLKHCIEKVVQLEVNKEKCCNKIEINEEIYERYSKKIFWKRDARKIMDMAERYIAEYKCTLCDLENQRLILDNNIDIELMNIER